jgi:hypothetical protein
MPAGFADGVDNDTTYTVGAGLSMQDNEIRIPQAGVTASMIHDGQVDVSKLNLPNVWEVDQGALDMPRWPGLRLAALAGQVEAPA